MGISRDLVTISGDSGGHFRRLLGRSGDLVHMGLSKDLVGISGDLNYFGLNTRSVIVCFCWIACIRFFRGLLVRFVPLL